MLQALRSVFARLERNIPPEVMEIAFEPWNHPDKTLDQIIYEKVILGSVRDDASRQGGKLLDIILQMDWARPTHSPSPYSLGMSGALSTYVIPPEAREFRDIVAVVSVRVPYNISSSLTGDAFNNRSYRGETVGSLACKALKSQTLEGTTVYPKGILEEGNVIRLTPPNINWVPWMVKVRLKFDDNFTGMNSSSLETFQRACEYAVQAYIYSHTIIRLGSTPVLRGADINELKDQISKYDGAAERYDEEIRKFHGAEILDPTRVPYILSRMVPHPR